MYKIIGADQREYGPVSADQIRQWITEGRVNAQTQIKPEGGADWQPLSNFPEFAGALAGPTQPGPLPQPLAAGPGDPAAAARQAVNGPAIGLMVVAIVGLLGVILGFVLNVAGLVGGGTGGSGNPQLDRLVTGMSGGLGILQSIIGAVIAVLILVGANKMRALQNYQLAFTVSILAMIPCVSPCCLLGLPLGIWAVVVLNRPEIKSQFT